MALRTEIVQSIAGRGVRTIARRGVRTIAERGVRTIAGRGARLDYGLPMIAQHLVPADHRRIYGNFGAPRRS